LEVVIEEISFPYLHTLISQGEKLKAGGGLVLAMGN